MTAEDLRGYLAFVLDLYDRFGKEGRRIREPLVKRQKKPMRSILRASAAQAGPGLIAEFGVHKGHSIRLLAEIFPERTIHGFDSFEGFPDDGRGDWRQDFSLPELPEVPANVRLHQGYFGDTLAPFVQDLEAEETAALLHIDCDIYSSAAEVFDSLGRTIRPGTVLLFDELVNYDEFLSNEMLALFEWCQGSGLEVRWAAAKGRLRPLPDFRTGVEGGFAGYRQQGFYQNAGLIVVTDENAPARRERFLDEAATVAEILGLA
ncbi:class I SAM-dependent methyltransferase [Parvularcula lutaonensis]|uniref:Class I SAM-dependent methyltransferase n=1 Tax=Parvularcula lutaonensis TaxID=491923 RepID=A0ABV7MAL5_9PROT|nr:class I SAM-dependent methyltransferase [Parvularcula lutaonensis]